MIARLLQRFERSVAIASLTRRYLRSAHVPDPCTYYLCGRKLTISGPAALPLLLDSYWRDSYGLRRFRSLDVIVDVGANVGTWSLHAAARFPHGRVIAFEPCSRLVPHLRQNAQPLGIEVHAAAVDGRRGVARLRWLGDPTASVLVEDADAGADQPCEVLAFNDLVARISGPVSFLKLDCEGSEYPILASEAMSEVQNVAGELHSMRGSNPAEAREILVRRGFEIETWRPSPSGREVLFWARNHRRVAPSDP